MQSASTGAQGMERRPTFTTPLMKMAKGPGWAPVLCRNRPEIRSLMAPWAGASCACGQPRPRKTVLPHRFLKAAPQPPASPGPRRVQGRGGLRKLSPQCGAQEAQFSTASPGTAERSVSIVTTVQLPKVSAMAAIIMSFWPMGRPVRRSSAAMRPYSKAAASVTGQSFQEASASFSRCKLRSRWCNR